MFQPQFPDLPDDVKTLLAPALAEVSRQARYGTMLVQGPKVDRAGKVAARANGEASYGPGFEQIALEVFGPALLAEIRGLAPGSLDQAAVQAERRERQCGCTSCTDEECEGDCDSCDDCCSQCNPGYSCCGCCQSCGDQHEYSDGPNWTYVREVGDGRYCRDCDHTCGQEV